jgi:hypothetical protein
MRDQPAGECSVAHRSDKCSADDDARATELVRALYKTLIHLADFAWCGVAG